MWRPVLADRVQNDSIHVPACQARARDYHDPIARRRVLQLLHQPIDPRHEFNQIARWPSSHGVTP